MRAPMLLGLGLLVACGDKGEDGTDGTDGSDGSGTTPGFDIDAALPEVFDSLDQEVCEGVQDTVPGSTSYFVGEYVKDGEDWVGTEWWVLFATDRWEEVGGNDCTITWIMSATEGEGGACGACGLHLDVNGALDPSRTSCPEDLYKGEEQWSESYDVALTGSGSTWYYAGSGNVFATGDGGDNAVTYLSDAQCDWF